MTRLLEVAAQVGQDFHGEISQRCLRSLDDLPWVTGRNRHAEVFTHFLPRRFLGLDQVLLRMCSPRKGIEMSNQIADIGIMRIWLETQLVLQSLGECENQVDCRDLSQQIFLDESWAFIDVNPNISCQITGLN